MSKISGSSKKPVLQPATPSTTTSKTGKAALESAQQTTKEKNVATFERAEQSVPSKPRGASSVKRKLGQSAGGGARGTSLSSGRGARAVTAASSRAMIQAHPEVTEKLGEALKEGVKRGSEILQAGAKALGEVAEKAVELGTGPMTHPLSGEGLPTGPDLSGVRQGLEEVAERAVELGTGPLTSPLSGEGLPAGPDLSGVRQRAGEIAERVLDLATGHDPLANPTVGAPNAPAEEAGKAASDAVAAKEGGVGGVSASESTDEIQGSLDIRDGALDAQPIDRSELGVVDSAILSASGLDSVPPGGTVTGKVNVNADLAAVLGVQVGAEAEVSIARSTTNPNQYTMSLGAGASVGVLANASSTAVVAGTDASARGALVGRNKLELTMDLSEPGEATDLAGFMAHSMAASAVAPALASPPIAATGLPMLALGAAAAFESMPGVDIPGEPLEYIRDHVSAVEIGGGLRASEELGLVALTGVTEEVSSYLEGGARLEFNEDGTKTVITGGLMGMDGTVKWKNGDLLSVEANVLGARLQYGLETRLTLGEDWMPQSVTAGLVVNSAASAGAFGVDIKGSVSLPMLRRQNPELAERITNAMESGDVERMQQVLEGAEFDLSSLTFTGSIDGSVGTALTLGAKPKEGGVGFEGAVGAGAQYTHALANGEFTFSENGIRTKMDMEGGLFRAEGEVELTYEQLYESLDGLNQQELPFGLNP